MNQIALCTIPSAIAAKMKSTVRCRSKFILILAPFLFAFCIYTYTELEVTKNLTKWLYSENVEIYKFHLKEHRNTKCRTKLNAILDKESMRQYGGLLSIESECTQACNNSYINCLNIREIKLGRRLGTGWDRVTFQGMFRGNVVAVKFTNYAGVSFPRCYDIRHKLELSTHLNDSLSSNAHIIKVRQSCVDIMTEKSKKELYVSKSLKHPVLVKLLGYCLRNTTDFFTSYDVTKRQIVSVWELGQQATGYELPTWQLRIQQCIKLVDFLLYLEKLSLYIADFKRKHFIFSRGNYKFIDFESFRSFEQPIMKYRNFNDAQRDMKILCDVLLAPLLNISFPSNVLNRIQPLISDIKLKPHRSLVAADWMSVLNTIEELI